jgi:hypothetical protein
LLALLYIILHKNKNNWRSTGWRLWPLLLATKYISSAANKALDEATGQSEDEEIIIE